MSDGQARSIPSWFHVPTIYPHVESVSLSDFDTDDILEYLKHKGATPDGAADLMCSEAGLWISTEYMERAATLILAGQREEARLHILGIVGDAMGRAL